MAARALKILAIDDNRDNLTTLGAVLADALPGCVLLTALDGPSGLALARDADPDAILLDIVMPNMDGFEVCRRLKSEERLRDVPVVFLTALGTGRESRVKALEVGAEAFLSKPTDDQEIVAQLRAMAQLKAANRTRRLETEQLAALVSERTRELEQELGERKRAEQALHTERDNLRGLLVAAPAAILVVDEQERVVLANPAAEQLFGSSVQDSNGRCGDFICCAHRADGSFGCGAGPTCAACPLTDAARQALAGRSVRNREVEVVVVVDGTSTESRWFVVNAEPLASEVGASAVLAMQDITELRHEQREREALQASLAQSDRLASMGMLAAGIAHEINNPLSYVLYNLESLAEDLPKLTDSMRVCHAELTSRIGVAGVAARLGAGRDAFSSDGFDDVLDRMREAVSGTQRIRQIARSLSTFARVEPAALQSVHVHRSIEHALTMASNELKYRARVVRDFGAVVPVLASEGKLAQVFLNLLLNAAHAIDEGHVEDNEIRVRTFTAGGDVVIEVSDTGTGIDPAHMGKLFEPFFTTKGVGVGSGLGLSLSKRIVTEFGGDITVQSEPGKGASFRVRLPAMASDGAEVTAAVSLPVAPPATVRGRILIVDDEAGIRASVARMLRGHEVTAVSSGEDARLLLETDRKFDIVFCDLMMPRMSGMELHAWMTQHDSALAERVVFITGGAFTPGASEYLARVGNARVEKPFDVPALRELTRQLVVARRGG